MEDDYNNNEFDLFEPEEPEEEKPPRYFARSVSNSILSGVCGGIGEYINLEPNLLRVIFVLGTFAGGWGIIAYITATLLLPIKPDPVEYSEDEITGLLKTDSRTIIGASMILSGIYFVIAPTGLFYFFEFLGGSTEFAFTILFVTAGFSILMHTKRNSNQEQPFIVNKLFRSREDKRFMGVCGGLADYFNMDSTLFRVVSVISILATAGISILLYFIFSYFLQYETELMPNDKQ